MDRGNESAAALRELPATCEENWQLAILLTGKLHVGRKYIPAPSPGTYVLLEAWESPFIPAGTTASSPFPLSSISFQAVRETLYLLCCGKQEAQYLLAERKNACFLYGKESFSAAFSRKYKQTLRNRVEQMFPLKNCSKWEMIRKELFAYFSMENGFALLPENPNKDPFPGSPCLELSALLQSAQEAFPGKTLEELLWHTPLLTISYGIAAHAQRKGVELTPRPIISRMLWEGFQKNGKKEVPPSAKAKPFSPKVKPAAENQIPRSGKNLSTSTDSSRKENQGEGKDGGESEMASSSVQENHDPENTPFAAQREHPPYLSGKENGVKREKKASPLQKNFSPLVSSAAPPPIPASAPPITSAEASLSLQEKVHSTPGKNPPGSPPSRQGIKIEPRETPKEKSKDIETGQPEKKERLLRRSHPDKEITPLPRGFEPDKEATETRPFSIPSDEKIAPIPRHSSIPAAGKKKRGSSFPQQTLQPDAGMEEDAKGFKTSSIRKTVPGIFTHLRYQLPPQPPPQSPREPMENLEERIRKILKKELPDTVL